MKDEAPLVYAVVVNWNGRDILSACLASVLASDYENLVTVVVDNGSTDGSQDLVRESFPGVRLVANPRNLRFAGGSNVGIRIGLEEEAQYVFLLNNDAEVGPNAVSALVGAAELRTEAAFLGPMIYFYDRRDVVWSAGGAVGVWSGHIHHHGIREKDTGQFARTCEVDYVTGCALLARSAAVRDIGLLDEGYYMYNEDTDWCARAHEAGYSVLFVPEAKVWHRVSMSSGGGLTPFKVHHRLKSTLRYFRLHSKPYHWLGILPATGARMLVFILRQLAAGKPALAAAALRGVLKGPRKETS